MLRIQRRTPTRSRAKGDLSERIVKMLDEAPSRGGNHGDPAFGRCLLTATFEELF